MPSRSSPPSSAGLEGGTLADRLERALRDEVKLLASSTTDGVADPTEGVVHVGETGLNRLEVGRNWNPNPHEGRGTGRAHDSQLRCRLVRGGSPGCRSLHFAPKVICYERNKPRGREGKRCHVHDLSRASRWWSVRFWARSASSPPRPHRQWGPTRVRCLTGTGWRRRRSPRCRGRTAVRHLHSRSTWAWFKALCTTRSTRSDRNSIGHICSRGVRARRRRSTLPSQRRRTTCSRSSSRPRPRELRSRVVRDS